MSVEAIFDQVFTVYSDVWVAYVSVNLKKENYTFFKSIFFSGGVGGRGELAGESSASVCLWFF